MPDDLGARPLAAETEQTIGAAGGLRAWAGRRSRVERGLLIAAAIFALFLAGLALNWFFVGRHHVTTDNAYVRADISLIAAKVGGYVRSIAVTDNQTVAAGDVLVLIEPADYEAELARARAEIARSEAQLRSIAAQRALAEADRARYRPLAERGLLSAAGMQQIEARVRQTGADEAAAIAAIAAARANVETAELNLERTIVRAPFAGVIGDRQAQLGQLVQPGAPLMAVVPLDQVYVIANFKETQLADIRPGQRAEIRPDIDRGLRLEGVVESIAPASGAEFSIIPMDTATGNFTKIVQRVPVRIRVAPEDAERARLRPGLSVEVIVDTRGPAA